MTTVTPADEIRLLNHSSRVIPLWVNGHPPYGVVATPASLDFSSTTVGTSSTQTVTITNTGFYSISPGTLSFTNPTEYLCTATVPLSLAPDESFDISVTYTPINEGEGNSVLTLVLSNGLADLEIALTGSLGWDLTANVDAMLDAHWDFIQRSVQPHIAGGTLPVATPQVSLSTQSIVFGTTIVVGDESDAMSLVITNTGTADLVIDNLAVSGDFELV